MKIGSPNEQAQKHPKFFKDMHELYEILKLNHSSFYELPSSITTL